MNQGDSLVAPVQIFVAGKGWELPQQIFYRPRGACKIFSGDVSFDRLHTPEIIKALPAFLPDGSALTARTISVNDGQKPDFLHLR